MYIYMQNQEMDKNCANMLASLLCITLHGRD